MTAVAISTSPLDRVRHPTFSGSTTSPACQLACYPSTIVNEDILSNTKSQFLKILPAYGLVNYSWYKSKWKLQIKLWNPNLLSNKFGKLWKSRWSNVFFFLLFPWKQISNWNKNCLDLILAYLKQNLLSSSVKNRFWKKKKHLQYFFPFYLNFVR